MLLTVLLIISIFIAAYDSFSPEELKLCLIRISTVVVGAACLIIILLEVVVVIIVVILPFAKFVPSLVSLISIIVISIKFPTIIIAIVIVILIVVVIAIVIVIVILIVTVTVIVVVILIVLILLVVVAILIVTIMIVVFVIIVIIVSVIVITVSVVSLSFRFFFIEVYDCALVIGQTTVGLFGGYPGLDGLSSMIIYEHALIKSTFVHLICFFNPALLLLLLHSYYVFTPYYIYTLIISSNFIPIHPI